VSRQPAAARVLLTNWRGHYTVPAAGLYPHQWSWDSGFIAIGLRHLSPKRAQQEMDSILSAQWTDGRIPQIVFNPGRDEDYSPGASFWRSDRLGVAHPPTAGLVQPPIHAWATLLVHQADPETSRKRGFLERAYPRLLAWHDYLRDRRDLGGTGLACVLHPWESGLDNSPMWDAALTRVVVPESGSGLPRPDLLHAEVTERPTDTDYRRYLYIAATYRDHHCDDAADHPFVMQDPGFNALWARSELALSDIADELGENPAEHRHRAEALESSLECLWDAQLGCYVAHDVLANEPARVRTVFGLLPLLLPWGRHTHELLATLRGEPFAIGEVHLVPSHDLTAPTFDPARYWRGPAWFNTAWLLAQALTALGLSADADDLQRDMLALATKHDFPEYLDPYTGEPHGTHKFSWTAALSLDVAVQRTRAATGAVA
jgi:hypothetical protein